MPKIQTTAQRRYRYEMIAKAMGEQCVWHKMKMGNVRRGPPHYKLVINHIDDDQTNWAWNNLDLLCYSCNERLPLILTLHDRVSQLQATGDQLERERERESSYLEHRLKG